MDEKRLKRLNDYMRETSRKQGRKEEKERNRGIRECKLDATRRRGEIPEV